MLIILDFDNDVLQQLLQALVAEKFDPYLTSVGGSGLGILSPYPQHRNKRRESFSADREMPGQVTPPETPAHKVDLSHDAPLRPAFEMKSTQKLSSWADNLGRWLYV